MKTSLVLLVLSAVSLTVSSSSAVAQAASRDGRPLAWAVRDALQRDPRGSPEVELLERQRRADLLMAQTVNARLLEAGMTGLLVACHEGQVELRGSADDAALRQRATELALGVADVRTVTNAMLVPGESAPAPASNAASILPTGEPIAPPTESDFAGSSTEPFAFVTTDGYAGRGIVVDEVDGIVRLSGDVNTFNARNYAVNAARSVAGVRVLHEELVVRPSTRDESRRLALIVQHQFDYDPLVQSVAPLVLVTVRDGVVRLEGTVQDESQFQQAELLAAIQTGVFAVENLLSIDESILVQPTRRGPVAIVRTR